MRTCIDQLLAMPHIDAPRLKGEVHYLAGRLEELRVQRTITNEAYLLGLRIDLQNSRRAIRHREDLAPYARGC